MENKKRITEDIYKSNINPKDLLKPENLGSVFDTTEELMKWLDDEE